MTIFEKFTFVYSILAIFRNVSILICIWLHEINMRVSTNKEKEENRNEHAQNLYF